MPIMENNEITEQTLSKWKSEILSTIQAAMSRERAAQEKKMEELCNLLIESNKSSFDALKQALVQLRKPTSEEQVTIPVSSSTPASSAICKENITRLLQTFEKALQSSGEMISKQNAEEVKMYIETFCGQFSSVTDEMEQKLSKAIAAEIAKLAGTLDGYSAEMTERNRQSLAEVQAENNLELQNLAKLLSQLTEANLTFQKNAEESSQSLTQNVNDLIENSEHFSETLSTHIADGTSQIESVMQRQIDRMISLNAEHEKKTVDAFQSAMDDYRDRFVQANAEAIAHVQSDMLVRMEETQQQLATLTSTVTAYISAAQQHEEHMQSELTMITQIVNDQSKAVTKSISDAMGNVDVTILQIQELIDNQGKASKAQMDGYADAINSSVNNGLIDYNNAIKDLKERITQLINAVEQQRTTVTETLERVTKHQQDAHKLANDDMKLLQEMIKKL